MFAAEASRCALQLGSARGRGASPHSPARGLGTAVNINGSNHFNAFVDVVVPQGAAPAGRVVLSLYFCDVPPPSASASGFVEATHFGVVPTALGEVVGEHGGGGAREAGQLLAPLAHVSNFAGGAWLRLELEAAQSVRLRLANIRGAASLSAVMFDAAEQPAVAAA